MPSIHFCRDLAEDEAAAVQERSIAHEEELRQFDNFISKLDDVPIVDVMDRFEREWQKENPYDCPWSDFRGAFGESVLHLIAMRRTVAKKHRRDVLDELLRQLMTQGESLIGLVYVLEPYVGESLLHMVVANSDVRMVETVLQHLAMMPDHEQYLNARASGVFFRHLVSSPMEPKGFDSDQFVTPLSVAMLAPQDDDIALTMVEMLIKAGAATEFRDEDYQIHSTVMHHLAKCRWNHGVDYQGRQGAGGFISVERLNRLFDLFTSGRQLHAVKRNTKDRHGNTALQLAAIIGNGEFLRCFIRQRAVDMWHWGHSVNMRFPLDGIDTGRPDNEEASVLELLALHRHKMTLSYGLFVHMIEQKWKIYGWKILVVRFFTMTFIVVLVTVATAFTNSISSPIRRFAGLTAMCISSVLVLYIVVMFAIRYRSAWFWRHRWVPYDSRFHASIWNLSVMNDFIVLVLAVVVCALHEWQEYKLKDHKHPTFLGLTDEIASVLIFVGWFQLLKYLRFFQVTGSMIGALPQIFEKDVLPLLLVILLFMMASAGAMKVATAHTISRSDEILGTFVSTFASLEESIHGADVNWRSTVEDRPLIAVIIFLIFLWIATIVLFNILIAMFTSRFQQIQKGHMRVYSLRWCSELITQEKFLPLWLWDVLDLQLGTSAHFNSKGYGTDRTQGSNDSDVEQGNDELSTETSPLLANCRERRWLSLEQDCKDETWGRPVDQLKVWS